MLLTLQSRSVLMLGIFFFSTLPAGHADEITANDYSQQIADLKAQFRAEMDSMRAAYEARIAVLESNISQIKSVNEKQDLAIMLAADNALNRTSNEAVAAEAEEIREGISRPWKTFDWPSKGFEFHGYLRASFGLNGSGAPQIPFAAPQVLYELDSYYRLGNEPSTYGELNFLNNFLDADMIEDGQRFKIEVTVAFTEGYFLSYVPVPGTANPVVGTMETWQYDRNDRFNVLQAYAEGSGVWKQHPEVAFWVGQRSYLNPEIHMNRLAIVDMSGYGCGMMGMSICDDAAKLSLAWIGGTLSDLTPSGDIPPVGTHNIPKNNLIVSLDEWQILDGSCTAWVTFAANSGGSLYTQTPIDPVPVYRHFPRTTGWAVGFIHTKSDFFGGFNQASIQYGYGAASNFYTQVNFPGPNDHSWTFRIADYMVLQPTQNFSVGIVALWQTGRVQGIRQTTMSWLSAGIRPVYHFNRNWSLAFEAAVDHTHIPLSNAVGKPVPNGSGSVYKFTIAPQITPDWDFAISPVLRIYATYAAWTNGYKGGVGGPTYRNATSGVIFGAQMEAFW